MVSPQKAAWLKDKFTVELVMKLIATQDEVRGRFERLAASGEEKLLRSTGVESETLGRVINLLRVDKYETLN